MISIVFMRFPVIPATPLLPLPTDNPEPLSNGVDYLWWHALHQDIASSQINIPITYQHAATQVVVVTIAGGENITL